MNTVSIIVPHYNSWDMLTELLNTIPNNGYFEVIVVDDHTKDNSIQLSKIGQEFPHAHFLINDAEKKGAGAARNKGLKKASGKWVLFADADDKFLPDFELNIEPYLESKFDIVFYTPTSFFEDKEADSLRHQTFERYIDEYLKSNDITKEHTLRYNFSPPWSKLIRRSLVEDNNIWFDETKVANDVMFSAKIGSNAEEITATKKMIYAVRQTSGSITSLVSKENFKIRFDVWVEMINYMQNKIPSNEFNQLNISIIPQLLVVFENKLGLDVVKYALKEARKNNIPLLDKRLFNLNFIRKSIRKHKELSDSTQRTTIKK